ncbi:MAG: trypsin-like peptidase domain-containing protein [Clostridia bacterium]|nr:trypsin-like peptidase domain-containing protein [Clostridia bacterium]
MKKIIPVLLIAALLLSLLTSCLATEKMSEYVGSMLGSVSTDNTTELINEVARNAVLSGVIVNATRYLGLQKTEIQGSGVIFNYSDGMFYVLTNFHVAYNDVSNGRNGTYTVTDAFDNNHIATLLTGSEELDLAVMRFAVDEEDRERLRVAPLAIVNASIATQVVAVGNPGGLHNSVTVGSIISYKDIDLDVLSVPVIYHTAPLDHGSSGGGIFNAKGELVGINYAIGESEDGTAKISFAVPIETVIGFLTEKDLLPLESIVQPNG